MQVSRNTQVVAVVRSLGPGERLILLASIAMLVAFMLLDGSSAYGTAPDFSAMSIEQKKREFFAFLSPMITDVNFQMTADHDRVRELLNASERGEEPGWFDRRWLERLAGKLEVAIHEMPLQEALQTLERRAGVVPESIVLAQAAMESGWGTSRFAREGNNYFGQRCYEAGCGMRPQARPDGVRFGLARFASPRASVESYMRNLNTHTEYRQFRELRKELRDRGRPITGLALVRGLSGYSERGADYVAEIAAMIRANDLE